MKTTKNEGFQDCQICRSSIAVLKIENENDRVFVCTGSFCLNGGRMILNKTKGNK